MKKALRIGYNRYYRDDIFKEHLSFIKQNISAIDEVALFAEYCHYGYWDLDYSAKNADVLRDRIKQYKDAGIKNVGINLLSTIGHLDEGWGVLPRAPLQYQVNESGIESKGCLCFSNDEYLDYISKRYSLYATTGADFIWLDDDLRVENHGVAINGCFCDNCLKKFNKISKRDYSRAELVELIETDETLREKWRGFKYDSMMKLISTIKYAIKTVNPNIEIGYMSVWLNSKTEWLVESGASKGRPGGGFYDESRPLEVFQKCFNVQSQISKYPDEIKDIQYEYEAFNYQTLDRTVHFTELETSLALMSGCSGVLYNNDIFNDRQELIDMLKMSAKKWDVLTHINKGCKPIGVYCFSSKTARLLNEIGIPVTADIKTAVAAVVAGKECISLSDDEIEQVMDINVLMDGEVLDILSDRGLSDLCGGKVGHIYESGMAERFGEHSFNGKYKGYYRDVFMNFTNSENYAYELEPAENAEAISYMEEITHKPFGCSMYKYENEKGSRFVVDGYLMLDSCKSAAKKEQLKNVIDWLAESKLPIMMKNTVKIIPCVTTDFDGNINIMLTNASFDDSGAFECIVRGKGNFRIINADGSLAQIVQKSYEEETVLTIENIKAWNYLLITNRENRIGE